MSLRFRIYIISLLCLFLLAGLMPAASAMNSEMMFNLDGYTLDSSETAQQNQTVQPPTANTFQQTLPQGAIQFDQGFTANALFGEEENGYQLTWNAAVNQYITVFVNGKQVSNGETVKGGDQIVVAVNAAAGYGVSNCEIHCTYDDGWGNNRDFGDITPEDATHFRTTIPASLNSNVELSVSIQKAYSISVNGIAVTDANKSDVIGNGGTVSYYPEQNVLMLSGANLNSIEIRTPLTILFTGNNSVGTIHSSSALTLSSRSATDQLTVTAPSAENSRAIHVEGASLTVSSGANVFAQSLGGEKLSAGVDVAGHLEVSGTLSTTGGSAAESCGIRCNTLAVKTVSSAGGGKVTASGGDCYTGGSSTGAVVSGNAVVEYTASLTAAGKGAASASRGISAGSLTVQGTASFTSGSSWAESSALYSQGSVASSGTLSARSGVSSGGASRGIYAVSLSVTGGALDAHAASGSAGSTGIVAAVTVSGGNIIAEGTGSAFSAVPVFSGGYQPQIRVSDLTAEETEADSSVAANYLKKYVYIRPRSLTLTPSELTLKVGESQKLSAAVPNGYSVSWYSSTPNVTVDQITGTVTGVSPGTATVTAKAYSPSNTESDSAACLVTVKAGGAAVTGIHFDQENVSLSTKYGLRTVKYWFSPLGAGSPELTWKCTDATGSIVRFEVSEAEQELYITSVGNGVAVISASTKNGISAYCRVTVSGIGGGDTSVYIDYIDNSGVWYYDWSDSFTVRCTGKVSELLGVYVDGSYIPQISTGGQRNYTVTDSGGKTLIVFTRAYMSRLAHSPHTLALSYSGYGTISKTIYIQSVRDAPRTGDVSLAGPALSGMLSLTAALFCMRKLRKKEQ